jgi:methyl-accepting chemotaxis protein
MKSGLISKLPQLTISTKLYAIFTVLAAIAVALAAVALVQARRQVAMTDEFQTAFIGAQNVQKINSLIYAVVMESRGVYMAQDIPTAKKYGDGLLKFNDQIMKVVSDWKTVVRTDDAAQFETFSKRIEQFVGFRKELVRRGVEISPEAGREYGDNDANRSVRTALNLDIDALAKTYDLRSRRISGEMEGSIRLTDILMTVLGAISIVITCFGIVLIWRAVVRPLAAITTVTEAVAGGDLQRDIPYGERQDEVGALARAVTVFRDAAIAKEQLEAEAAVQRAHAEEQRLENEAVQAKAVEDKHAHEQAQAKAKAEIAEEQLNNARQQAQAAEEQGQVVTLLATALGKISDGDLTVRLPDSMRGAYAQIRTDFNGMAERLHEIVVAISNATGDVSNAAVEISNATTDLSQRTEEQAAGLEETSASMEHISTMVKQNAQNAQAASQLAAGTREVADRSGVVVASAVDAMSRIAQSSTKITDIIGVIDEIARQTNLLALNAAVEAARAGDAGRGFAVVASEVRSLAQRSSQAAKDIKDLITLSGAQVQDGVDLVNQAGKSLGEIVDSIKSVAEIVSGIAAASAEQSAGLDEVNKALTQMDKLTQQNSAFVEENAATAKTLEQQAAVTGQQISFFTLGEADEGHSAAPMRRAS